MLRVAINGCGRIGRLLVRILANQLSPSLQLVAINSPGDIKTMAHLIQYDSVHGKSHMDIAVEGKNLIINHQHIKYSSFRSLDELNWQDVDIVFECSGKFNDATLAEKHILAGAKKVIVSAPCSNADATIVMGVNENQLTLKDKVISAGSCTTNALVPMLNILEQNFGIEFAGATTIHAYTGDQNLVDNNHQDLRRARAANLSIIPTKTGAAKLITQILPSLAGKFQASAVRVPTSNVSLIDLYFQSKHQLSCDLLHDVFKIKSQSCKFISVASVPLVSIDFVGDASSVIIDPFETKLITPNCARMIGWYDNEWGFSHRMIDIAHYFLDNKMI